MALPPKFAGHKLTFTDGAAATSNNTLHTLEVVLDYACPFSAKMWKTLEYDVFPLIKNEPKLASKVQFIFRQQIQPWHPTSTYLHEAALAVLRLKPDAFYKYSTILMERQKEFFDTQCVNETRNDTYKRLAKLAKEVGVEEEEVYKLLRIKESMKEVEESEGGGDGNGGNGVTVDVKLVTRMGRLTGVHVTPTVLMDGVVQPGIESSFSKGDWEEWLRKNVA